MNDFTKEELQQIMQAVHGEWPIPYDLGHKLQSMIDNYCEHEWEVYRKGSIVLGIYCEKCSKKLKGYK
jgi:hypothetical protein